MIPRNIQGGGGGRSIRRRPGMAGFLMSGLFLLAMGTAAADEIHQAGIQPRAGDNFTLAEFRCYVPPNIGTVNGVLVLVPPFNEDGRGMADQERWREFAKNYGVALVACFFEGDEKRDYSNARRGSGQALLRVLRDLADQSGRRELADANLMIWGVSSGAQFAATLAMEKPDRVIGFASLFGFNWIPADGASRKTPGLFITSRDLEGGAADKTRRHFKENRSLGATWAYFETDRADQVGEELEQFAQVYLGTSFILRQKSGSRPGSRLESLTSIDCWVAPHADGILLPVRAVELPRSGQSDSSWCPSKYVAEQWILMKKNAWAKQKP
jgi:pimeloyl-ACP methyl ester carboxylesterase